MSRANCFEKGCSPARAELGGFGIMVYGGGGDHEGDEGRPSARPLVFGIDPCPRTVIRFYKMSGGQCVLEASRLQRKGLGN